MTVEDCIAEYLNLGGNIFGKPRYFHELMPPFFWINRTKYNAKNFVNVINDVTERRGKRNGGSRFESDADLCRTFVDHFAPKLIRANRGTGLHSPSGESRTKQKCPSKQFMSSDPTHT
jgi:hypothetical protein